MTNAIARPEVSAPVSGPKSVLSHDNKNTFTKNDALAVIKSTYINGENATLLSVNAAVLHFMQLGEVNKASIKVVKDFLHNSVEQATTDMVNMFVSNAASYVNKRSLSVLHDVTSQASTANQALKALLTDMLSLSFTATLAITNGAGFDKIERTFEVKSLNMLKGYLGNTMQNHTLWSDAKHLPAAPVVEPLDEAGEKAAADDAKEADTGPAKDAVILSFGEYEIDATAFTVSDLNELIAKAQELVAFLSVQQKAA